MATAERNPDVLDRILASPLAKQAAAELAEETLAQRRGHVAVLVSCEADSAAQANAYLRALQPAAEAVEAARGALVLAELELQKVHSADFEVRQRIESRERAATTALVLSADPVIAETRRKLYSLLDRIRASFAVADEYTTMFDGSKHYRPRTNSDVINARLAQVLGAIQEVEALKLAADPVSPAIAAILERAEVRRVAGELQ